MFDMQNTYRAGIRTLDELAQQNYRQDFVELADLDQDRVLELLSGSPKPGVVAIGTTEPVTTFLQGSFDEGLDFFSALCLHTREGFYCDPVYGGNKNQMGWSVIGFPGPNSLKDTMDGTYDTTPYFYQGDYEWEDLIPHLKVTPFTESDRGHS